MFGFHTQQSMKDRDVMSSPLGLGRQKSNLYSLPVAITHIKLMCTLGNLPDIVISLDRRDEGWRLFRYDGTPVDFSLISDRPEITFAHKSGFMAKTKERLAIDDLIALVSQAVTGF